MRLTALIDRVFQQEDINFFVTNKIPRRVLTNVVGWFSRIENRFVREVSIATLQMFAGDLSLHEAKKASFTSLHDCFVRELKDGARPINSDPRILVSPCDAIVGATGTIQGNELLQAKGSMYTLDDLFGGRRPIERYRDGRYVTLRLTSSMYHRFHAPADCEIHETTYISGDTWNVNPIALKRIARLYCKNERAVIHGRLDDSGGEVALVAVAAILVASVHLNFVDVPLNLKYRGPNHIPCCASFRKGDELGYFHHGSTIIVIASAGFDLCANVCEGERIRMGEPLLVSAEYAERS
jgi:phosphatidylserine decarboxylase